jgi:hypothetical protein
MIRDSPEIQQQLASSAPHMFEEVLGNPVDAMTSKPFLARTQGQFSILGKRQIKRPSGSVFSGF